MRPFKVQTLIRLSHYTTTVIICFRFSFFDSLPPVSLALIGINYICIKCSKANNKCNSLFWMGIAPRHILEFRALNRDTNVRCIFITIFFFSLSLILFSHFDIVCGAVFSFISYFSFMGAIPWKEQATRKKNRIKQKRIDRVLFQSEKRRENERKRKKAAANNGREMKQPTTNRLKHVEKVSRKTKYSAECRKW